MERKPVIKNCDMNDDMKEFAIDQANKAFETYTVEKEICAFIKKKFDEKYNPTWHVIIGKSFGAWVNHETKNYIYFYLGNYAILLWKSG